MECLFWMLLKVTGDNAMNTDHVADFYRIYHLVII
jgi:hypothetical protein